MSLLPSEVKLLTQIQRKLALLDTEYTPAERMYAVELVNQGVLSKDWKENRSSSIKELEAYKLEAYRKLHNLPIIEQPEPTPAELFARIRNYVVEQAGTKPLLQIMYDVYSWPEVQKNCGNKGWLADRQIELGLQVYLGKHRGEAFDFCTQDPKKPADF